MSSRRTPGPITTIVRCKWDRSPGVTQQFPFVGMGPGSSPGRHWGWLLNSIFKQRRRCDFAISRRESSEVFKTFVPLFEKRAQGRPGARCTRGLVCKMHIGKRTRAYRFSGGNPAFPAQWFTAYFVLSPVTGLFATVAREWTDQPLANVFTNLTPASGRQDHTTSPSASAPFARVTSQLHIASCRVHRIPPHVRDDRDPPLSSGETARADSTDLPDGESEIFLAGGLDRLSLICPSRLGK